MESIQLVNMPKRKGRRKKREKKRIQTVNNLTKQGW